MESVCVAFDVEASGRTTSECEYPTIAYGYCLGTLDGKILERAQVNIAVNWPT